MSKRRARSAATRQDDDRRSGRTVTATEAAKNFGAIVDRVRDERAVYIVERSGTPVAQIGPIGARRFTVRDFVELVRSRPGPPAGDEYLRAVEEGIAFFNRPTVPTNPWDR